MAVNFKMLNISNEEWPEDLISNLTSNQHQLDESSNALLNWVQEKVLDNKLTLMDNIEEPIDQLLALLINCIQK